MCVILGVESRLWSGSADRTIRVWEISSGQCLGVLTSYGVNNNNNNSSSSSSNGMGGSSISGLGSSINPAGITSGAASGNVNVGFGHTDAVSCLEFLPFSSSSSSSAAPGNTAPSGQGSEESYIASGGADGELKLWRTNGEFVHSISHGSFITAMKHFQDDYGGD